MNIKSYDFGTIDVDGKTYTTDIVITPDAVRDGWWRREGHRLHTEDLAVVVDAKPDILVIGTGFFGRMTIPEETTRYLKNLGIDVRSAETSEAVKAFNELQRTSARVAAALHLTC